jgi:Tol biopolymer transport system component
LITPAALAQAGTAEVTVRTGPPGGGTSTGKPFIILSRVATVNVRVTQPILWVGEELQIQATPQDASGNDLPTRATTWSTSDATVLAVNASGVVRPLKEGYATVQATVDGKVGSEGVYVKAAPTYDLMYDSNRGGGNRELWIVSLGPNATPRRWLPEGFQGEDAATNHDGTKIVFVSRDEFQNTDVWVANRDGSGLTRLTTYGGADDQPTWAPDGRIVFRSTRGGQSQLWIMNADGSGQRNLMGDSFNVLGGQQSHPTIAPSGKIFFQMTYPDYGSSSLASMPINGTWQDVQLHTPAGYNDSEPAISWSGHMLMVHRKQGATDYGLIYLDANANQVISLSYPGPGFMPAWARNDQWHAYSSSPNGTNPIDIYVGKPHDFWRKRITNGDVGRNPVFIRR